MNHNHISFLFLLLDSRKATMQLRSNIQSPSEVKAYLKISNLKHPAIFKSKHFHFLPFLLFICISRLPFTTFNVISPKINRKGICFTPDDTILTSELSERRSLTTRQRRMRTIQGKLCVSKTSSSWTVATLELIVQSHCR